MTSITSATAAVYPSASVINTLPGAAPSARASTTSPALPRQMPPRPIPRAAPVTDAMRALGAYVNGSDSGVATRMADAAELLVDSAKFASDRADGFNDVKSTTDIERALDPVLGQLGFSFMPRVLSDIHAYTSIASRVTGLEPGDVGTAFARTLTEVFPDIPMNPWSREGQMLFIAKHMARGEPGVSVDDLVGMLRERVTVVDSTSESYMCDVVPTGREGFGVLVAGAEPGRSYFAASAEHAKVKIGSLDVELQTLRDAGLDTIACLLEKHTEREAAIAEAKGIKWLPLPIEDFNVPTFAQADALVRAIVADLSAGKNVLVHCAGGKGRTGTINACVLVRLGFNPKAAIEAVRAARPGSVETPEQFDFIFDYAYRIAGENRAG